jgi:hypothetical protein
MQLRDRGVAIQYDFDRSVGQWIKIRNWCGKENPRATNVSSRGAVSCSEALIDADTDSRMP